MVALTVRVEYPFGERQDELRVLTVHDATGQGVQMIFGWIESAVVWIEDLDRVGTARFSLREARRFGDAVRAHWQAHGVRAVACAPTTPSRTRLFALALGGRARPRETTADATAPAVVFDLVPPGGTRTGNLDAPEKVC